MAPKISIITVVRNAPDDLRLTLNALASLKYPNKELIVIDGASTDSTPEVIGEFAHALQCWVSEPDSGLYDAMNKGLIRATGEYVWFVNAGDMPCNDIVLNRVFAPSEYYSDIYFGEALIISPNGEPQGLRRKKLPKTLSADSLRRGMVVCHQAFIPRRSIVPMYDTQYKYVADIDWVIRTLKNAKTITNTNLVLCKFAEGGISTRHRTGSLRERFSVMQLHYGLTSTIVSHFGFLFDALFRRGYRREKS